jgi:hypothetical protein
MVEIERFALIFPTFRFGGSLGLAFTQFIGRFGRPQCDFRITIRR